MEENPNSNNEAQIIKDNFDIPGKEEFDDGCVSNCFNSNDQAEEPSVTGETKNEPQKPTLQKKIVSTAQRLSTSSASIKSRRDKKQTNNKRPSSLPAEFSDISKQQRYDTHLKWFRQKEEDLRKQLSVKAAQNMSQRKVNEEKRLLASATYESWKKKKDAVLKDRILYDKKNIETKIVEEKGVNEQKQAEADKVYKAWKKDKDQKIKYAALRSKTGKSEQELFEEKLQQKKNSATMFQRWKEVKDEQIMIEKRGKNSEMAKNRARSADLKQQGRLAAFQAYEEWLDEKEKQRIEQRRRANVVEDRKFWPVIPWIPPNGTTTWNNRISHKT